MPIIDLNQLPAPDVVEELDFETILAERKATLISLYPEDQQEAVARTLMLESEPLVKLLEENAYRELIWRQRVNEAARAVMLACAAGNDLYASMPHMRVQVAISLTRQKSVITSVRT